MGDDHGPAVGEDFKYSTGLTTAGKREAFFGRGGERERREQWRTKEGSQRLSLSLAARCGTFVPLSSLFFFLTFSPNSTLSISPFFHHTEATTLLEQYGRNELQEKKQSK